MSSIRTVLGRRPATKWNLNGASFQQDALVTHKDWQYAVTYQDASYGVRHVFLSRRRLVSGGWETIEFVDYDQTHDDGHNTISLGISSSDGRIHIVWDLHSSEFVYRISATDLTSEPESAIWSSQSFGPVLHWLPGLEGSAQLLSETTYPRFVSLPKTLGGALMLEVRTGISGLGSDWLFAYTVRGWEKLGIYLEGIENNPYINGLDLDLNGGLHVSFCYRDYIPCSRGITPSQHVGPNGPENNHDLCYVSSPFDEARGYPGVEWFNQSQRLVGRIPRGVVPCAEGIRVFTIPKGSGVLNQEAQCLGPEGLYVLNREDEKGSSTWYLYFIPKTGRPCRKRLPVQPISSTSSRGKLVFRQNRLLALLPTAADLLILDVKTGSTLHTIAGAGGPGCQEVLYDRYRQDVLSLFLCIENQLVVVDIRLRSLEG